MCRGAPARLHNFQAGVGGGSLALDLNRKDGKQQHLAKAKHTTTLSAHCGLCEGTQSLQACMQSAPGKGKGSKTATQHFVDDIHSLQACMRLAPVLCCRKWLRLGDRFKPASMLACKYCSVLRERPLPGRWLLPHTRRDQTHHTCKPHWHSVGQQQQDEQGSTDYVRDFHL